MKTSYSDQLKDPRWQKRRLHILERDGWACRRCQSKDKTLHVHHALYRKGAKPWEYEDEALVTVCEECHKVMEEDRDRVLLSLVKDPANSDRILALALAMEAKTAIGLKWLVLNMADYAILFLRVSGDQISSYDFRDETEKLRWELIENLVSADRDAGSFYEAAFERQPVDEEDN